MISEINQVLQIATVTVLVLICLLLIRHIRQGMHAWVGVGFTLSIICYLVIESNFIQQSSLLFIIALTGAIAVPVFFWLLSKAIFDDHFKATPATMLWFLLLITPHMHIYLRNTVEFPGQVKSTLYVIDEIASIGFLVAGLYTGLRTRKGDLIDSRLRFRNIFIVTTAALIGITLIVEATPLARQSIDFLQSLQRTAMLCLSLYFLMSNIILRPGFFFKEYPKSKLQTQDDPLLLEKLQSMLGKDRIYKKEGLTIGELAQLMNEQEYRLRRLINGQLGFKNFNDFLNQYRIREASQVLSDPSQNRKTILEIAYDLGYQSIGPFNRAFKELKGITPTAYRKNQQYA